MKKVSLGVLILACGFLISTNAYSAWGGGYGPGMMGWGIGGFLGSVVMVLFWVLVVMGIVYAVRYFTGPQRGTQGESPLDIAKKRYAKGEISKEEYEKLKEDLRNM